MATIDINIIDSNIFVLPSQLIVAFRKMIGIIGLIIISPVLVLIMPLFYVAMAIYIFSFYWRMARFLRSSDLSVVRSVGKEIDFQIARFSDISHSNFMFRWLELKFKSQLLKMQIWISERIEIEERWRANARSIKRERELVKIHGSGILTSADDFLEELKAM